METGQATSTPSMKANYTLKRVLAQRSRFMPRSERKAVYARAGQRKEWPEDVLGPVSNCFARALLCEKNVKAWRKAQALT
jgi:hypothetical protein